MNELPAKSVFSLAYPVLDLFDCKVHLANVNPDGKDPLVSFLTGDFKEFQEKQSRKNFTKKYVMSLIQLRGRNNKWLFAGIYKVNGVHSFENSKGKAHFRYDTEELPDEYGMVGRLVITYEKSGRQPYLLLNPDLLERMKVAEIKPKRHEIDEFPGNDKDRLSKEELTHIVNQNIESWHAGLSYPGIYLITDTLAGKHYVGKADGDEGIWQRWCQYAKDSHGGNIGLKQVLKANGSGYAKNFQYSILEITVGKTADEVYERENHWKAVLDSKSHGYNEN